MKSSDIRAILHKNNMDVKVLALDEFRLAPPGNYIVNSDPSHLPGKHWMAVFYARPMEFFDPLARPPTYYKLDDKLLINYIYNFKQVQGSFSELCGEFCIYYLYNRLKGVTMPAILQKLDNDFYVNDNIVRMFVHKIKQK